MSVAGLSTVAAVRISQERQLAEQNAVAERAARLEAERLQSETDRALEAEKSSLAKALAAEETAKSSQRRAETEAATSAKVASFLVELFAAADPLGLTRLGFRRGDEIGKDITLRDLLDRGVRQASESLADQPAVRATLLDTLGKVYTNLALIDQAEPLLREAYEIRQQHSENESELASSLLNMGVMLRWQGKYDEAEPLLRRALEIRALERFGKRMLPRWRWRLRGY